MIKKQVELIDEQLREVRASFSGSAYKANTTGSGYGHSDKTFILVSKVYDLDEQLTSKRIEWLEKLKRVEMICNFPVLTETQQEVLNYRYFSCLKWEEVAKKMSYDIRHVVRLHKEALTRLAKAGEELGKMLAEN